LKQCVWIDSNCLQLASEIYLTVIDTSLLVEAAVELQHAGINVLLPCRTKIHITILQTLYSSYLLFLCMCVNFCLICYFLLGYKFLVNEDYIRTFALSNCVKYKANSSKFELFNDVCVDSCL